MKTPQLGTLLVVSGPSGSGKTTLCRRLAQNDLAHYSISCTTRSPREGEIHGQDYFFLSKDSFLEQVEAGAFLEHAEVHGNYYGTLVSEVLTPISQGKSVVLDIDVQGARSVRKFANEVLQRAYADVFVMPSTVEELRKRLTLRATDSEEVIQLRMHNAMEEIKNAYYYQYQLLSTTREADFDLFCALFRILNLRTSLIDPE